MSTTLFSTFIVQPSNMEAHLTNPERSTLGGSGNVAVGDLDSWFKSEGASVHEAYGVETYYSFDQSRFIPGAEPPVLYVQQQRGFDRH